MKPKKPLRQLNQDTARILVGCHYDIQKQRIESSNQLFALKESGADEGTINDLKNAIQDKLLGIEKDIAKRIKTWVEAEPIYDLYLKDVKGIGPLLAAGLISEIKTPTRFANPSKLWAYAGLAPGQKLQRGKKANWNTRLKTLCWKIGESFVKGGDEYRKVYDQKRTFYDAKRPEESDGHRYAMAKRKTVKIFLVNLWTEWWKIETGKKAPRGAYVHDRLKHTTKLP